MSRIGKQCSATIYLFGDIMGSRSILGKWILAKM